MPLAKPTPSRRRRSQASGVITLPVSALDCQLPLHQAMGETAHNAALVLRAWMQQLTKRGRSWQATDARLALAILQYWRHEQRDYARYLAASVFNQNPSSSAMLSQFYSSADLQTMRKKIAGKAGYNE